jgi:multiple sugar transport system ATP-binding protein
MASTVRLESITKIFGKKVLAVDNISLTLTQGKLITLLGPSGCGKTTLLRIIAGLEEQTSGSVYFDDKNVNNVSTRDREVAMVFQSYALYPHMTVNRNLAYGLKMRKTPKEEIEKNILRIAEMLGIEELLHRKPKELSGGQQQRVALGRAIIRNSRVFLLDEPLSNLDAKLRAKMRTEIVTLQKKLGHTMIYVTHDQLEAMSMSDEIVLMNQGKVMQTGTPMEIFENPTNMFVASFIGTPSINFLQSKLKDENGSFTAYVGDWQIPLTERLSNIIRQKNISEAILGIRPEYLTIHESENLQDSQAEIRVIEPVGSEMFIHTTIQRQEVVTRCGVIPGLKEGQRVYLEPIQEKILLFDPNTEESLLS